MPANIETVVRNGQLVALTQKMIQERLEEFAQAHRRLKSLHVSVDLDNPARPAVEITSPIGQQELVGKASADNVVQAVDEAIRRIQQALQERKDQIQEQQPAQRDDRHVKIGGGVAAVLLLALLAFNITPSGNGTYPVSGTVTYQGKPVPRGLVVFVADYSHGNKASQAYAPIIDGKYESPQGKGHGGGAYVVQVTGFDGVPYEVEGEGMDENGSPLFEMYQQQVELKPASEEVNIEVPES